MRLLVIKSWLLLLYFELVMHFRDFKVLHEIVCNESVVSIPNRERSPERLCQAVDLACVFYFKPVMCLQRSAATAVLLRRYGWKAEMVIGVQIVPFKSHAWVEVGGAIVNDKSYLPDIYNMLKRC